VRIPSATYRLQFNSRFRFDDALGLLDYLQALGITDIYASPLFKARRGSLHGYDVTDPNQINPEIGTQQEFDAFTQALQARGMGLLLDIVPNHMAASLENPWWIDVLAKGEGSPFARFFDVNWQSGKVLLPILGRPYGEALENQEIPLQRRNGEFVLKYFDKILPVSLTGGLRQFVEKNIDTINGQRGDPESFDALDRVISAQHYRLAYWRKAADAINYRRFFDINDLIGLRVEDDAVFNATHEFVLNLAAEKKVTGLRVDHIDGLLDPVSYLNRLGSIYVVVEKILAGPETLRPDWKVHGTSGYDFLNIVNNVFIEPHGFSRLKLIYSEFTGNSETCAETFRTRKRQVMDELFAGEVHALTNRLLELAAEDRYARDLSREQVRQALIAITAYLSVYRTYICSFDIAESDRQQLESTVASVAETGDRPALKFLRQVLLLEPPRYLQHRRADYLTFVMQWQQFTGPVMAKGLEDTTFYVYNPLISVNEVGGDPHGPEASFGIAEFHLRNRQRAELWPWTLNATSTHDTKRSEDVRNRINVLSEVPEEWRDCLAHWSHLNAGRAVPDANEQLFIYQTLVGCWPISRERLHTYIVKALREAKTHTSWLHIDEQYERQVLQFVDKITEGESSKDFLAQFLPFQRKIAYYGALNSLSQIVLKMTAPGVPDFYQGTECWDFSLADPDNRRPVDYQTRSEMLDSLNRNGCAAELLKDWEDGRLKMFVIAKALRFRLENRNLFLHGEYIPVAVSGRYCNHLVTFLRRYEHQWAIVAVPRFWTQLTSPKQQPADGVWSGTRLELPFDAPRKWKNIFTDEQTEVPLTASSLFATSPLAVMAPQTGSRDRERSG
jgi:(1->4)-alpha-D-glucan 1-alpha-D-glucosylmutase